MQQLTYISYLKDYDRSSIVKLPHLGRTYISECPWQWSSKITQGQTQEDKLFLAVLAFTKVVRCLP